MKNNKKYSLPIITNTVILYKYIAYYNMNKDNIKVIRFIGQHYFLEKSGLNRLHAINS